MALFRITYSNTGWKSMIAIIQAETLSEALAALKEFNNGSDDIRIIDIEER